jgi:hypothetical protein
VYDLKQMIKNELDKDKGLATKLAQVAGLANPSPLYKFLNEPEREMNDFRGLLEIVKYLFMDREKEIMHDYILTLDPNGKCARISLEYSLSNRMYDITDTLISKMMNCKNAESREWATIYNIDRMVDKGDLNLFDSIDAINDVKIKTNEMKSFGKMIQTYAYYGHRMFEMMFQVSIGLEKNVKSLKDDYMRFSYLCRLGLVMIGVNLHLNYIEEARRQGQMILDNSTQDSMRSVAYHQLGNSYIFEDYQKAIDYLMQSRLATKGLHGGEVRLNKIERSINFLQNYWCIEAEYLKPNSNNILDIHELAFCYIKKSEPKKATEILDDVEINSLSNNQKGFHFFYRGLLSNNREDFYKSIKYFKLSGDKFYRNASLLELKKLGENEIVLETLSV